MRKDPVRPEVAPRPWTRVLVPAFDRPYSTRSLEVAGRLAQSAGASVLLAYLVEVPRTLALEAQLEEAEDQAAGILSAGEEVLRPFKLGIETRVHRTRDVREGILKLVKHEGIDLMVLGGRPDEMRGLPSDLNKDLFLNAPCEVVLDYIANEK